MTLCALPMARDEQHNYNIFAEETDNPRYADDRFFYKVEKWTKDGSKLDRLLYAGTNRERVRNQSHSPEEHARRKRALIHGPKEFRDIRADQPKKKV